MHRYAGIYGSVTLFVLISIGSISVLADQTLSLNLMRKIGQRQNPIKFSHKNFKILNIFRSKFPSLEKEQVAPHEKAAAAETVKMEEDETNNDWDSFKSTSASKGEIEDSSVNIAAAQSSAASLPFQKKQNPALSGYKFLSLSLFQKPQPIPKSDYKKFEQLGENIRKVLADFAVDGKMVGYQPGSIGSIKGFFRHCRLPAHGRFLGGLTLVARF